MAVLPCRSARLFSPLSHASSRNASFSLPAWRGRDLRPPTKLRAADGKDSDFNEELKRDLLKFGGNEPSVSPSTSTSNETEKIESGGFKETIDKVLIADFFFVLFALGWFTSGVLFNTFANTSFVLDVWIILWPVVFQPAIGVLMLGALVSGAAGWAKEKAEK